MNSLRIHSLSKRYGAKVALDGVDLEISQGLFGLLGPNGAGKSTLMRTIATLQSPDAGLISFAGLDVLRDPLGLRRRLGYLPQDFGVYPGVSARSLLDHLARLKGFVETASRRSRVEEMLRTVHLDADADREVAGFSGGMRQRFGVAQALLARPELLIVDEPTAGLDPTERNRLLMVLAEVAKSAVVLLSTHIVQDVENICGRLAILAGGKIVAEGTPADLRQPFEGRVWERRVEAPDLPVGGMVVLQTLPQAGGFRQIALADVAPGGEWTPRAPDLEDAYHARLSIAGRSVEP